MWSLARSAPHWIAGPIGYKQSEEGVYPGRRVTVCKWEFIGLAANGEIRRWHLCFSLQTRTFTAKKLTVSEWDQAHAEDLARFYCPTAVLRSMLPRGDVATALRAMLPDKDIAEITALSITGGRRG